ncbi:MAG: hypothetical protein D6797_03950 [Bdellovibrio sp.]|nr:MAG: hypothetical protein D6797_03950 [Bdellovibrio sp.]
MRLASAIAAEMTLLNSQQQRTLARAALPVAITLLIAALTGLVFQAGLRAMETAALTAAWLTARLEPKAVMMTATSKILKYAS